MKTQTYTTLRPVLKTGDIVLFAGKGGISDWIKWFSGSTWSHVGMIVRSDEWDMLLLWESTTLTTLADVESGQCIRGVQLVPFGERLRQYKGDVAVRLLSRFVTDPMRLLLREFRREVRGRPYERRYFELLKAAYDGPFGGNTEDLSSLFCSELVAEAYQRMGLLSEEQASNEFTPRDFSTEAKQPLAITGAYELGAEIKLLME